MKLSVLNSDLTYSNQHFGTAECCSLKLFLYWTMKYSVVPPPLFKFTILCVLLIHPHVFEGPLDLDVAHPHGYFLGNLTHF